MKCFPQVVNFLTTLRICAQLTLDENVVINISDTQCILCITKRFAMNFTVGGNLGGAIC